MFGARPGRRLTVAREARGLVREVAEEDVEVGDQFAERLRVDVERGRDFADRLDQLGQVFVDAAERLVDDRGAPLGFGREL